MRVVPVALCLALVLAGCGGVSSADGPTPRPTLTPAPVPSQPATAVSTPSSRLAPGLALRGVVAPGRLLAAHRDRLVGTAYLTERSRTRTTANGTVRSRVRVRARYDGSGGYLVNRTIDGTDTERLGTTTRVEQYADADGGYRRRVVDGGSPTYSRVPPTSGVGPEPTAVLADPMAGRDVVLAFAAVDATVVARVSSVGPSSYVLAGSEVRSREALRSFVGRSDVSDVGRVSLRASVSETGLVESVAVRYTVDTGTGVEHVERRARFAGVGNTTVERPRWYAAADRVASAPA